MENIGLLTLVRENSSSVILLVIIDLSPVSPSSIESNGKAYVWRSSKSRMDNWI